jgi:regulator of sirC expression with transglutaminase-like and TPR domain
MFFKWETQGLVVGDGEGIEHFPPVKTRLLWVIIFILVVLAGMAAAVLYLKDVIGSRMGDMSTLSQLFEMKGEDPIKPGSVRGRVKRPSSNTPPPMEKKASLPHPAASASRTPESPKKQPLEKGAPDGALVPAWTTPVGEETALSFEEDEREIRGLNAFIEKDGENADAYYSRGWFHARMGDLENAERDFTRAIEINNRNGDAYYNRGLILARMGKFDLAIKDFEEAIELNPHAADAYCNRGSAYFQMGKRDLAMKDYVRGLEIKPNDADLYYNRGLLHLSEGRKAEAKADFTKATALREKPSSEPSEKITDVPPPGPGAK